MKTINYIPECIIASVVNAVLVILIAGMISTGIPFEHAVVVGAMSGLISFVSIMMLVPKIASAVPAVEPVANVSEAELLEHTKRQVEDLKAFQNRQLLELYIKEQQLEFSDLVSDEEARLSNRFQELLQKQLENNKQAALQLTRDEHKRVVLK